jgi:uncharacterized Zn-binding protein involved in type VI secretion
MGQPAAKQGDQVTATDTHIVLVPAPPGPPVPTPLPHPFAGILQQSLSANVKIMGLAAATVSSVAINTPPHIPTPPGTSFTKPPANKGRIVKGSATVMINKKAAARSGDTVMTCNDPADAPVGTIVASGTVLIGG